MLTSKYTSKFCKKHLQLNSLTTNHKGEKMTITDPRLARETTRVPRRSDYVKRPVLSATIHPDLKRTLVAMSERSGMSISQVTDEVLYTGLIEMQELPELAE